jgi:hypothetical protein
MHLSNLVLVMSGMNTRLADLLRVLLQLGCQQVDCWGCLGCRKGGGGSGRSHGVGVGEGNIGYASFSSQLFCNVMPAHALPRTGIGHGVLR